MAQLQPGCHLWTMDHMMTVDESEDITINSKWLDPTWTLNELFNHL
jgi:hypothetical protein